MTSLLRGRHDCHQSLRWTGLWRLLFRLTILPLLVIADTERTWSTGSLVSKDSSSSHHDNRLFSFHKGMVQRRFPRGGEHHPDDGNNGDVNVILHTIEQRRQLLFRFLRIYRQRHFGNHPTSDAIDDEQRLAPHTIVQQIVKELYGSGAPLWAVSAWMDQMWPTTMTPQSSSIVGPYSLAFHHPQTNAAPLSNEDTAKYLNIPSTSINLLHLAPGYNLARLHAVQQIARRLVATLRWTVADAPEGDEGQAMVNKGDATTNLQSTMDLPYDTSVEGVAVPPTANALTVAILDLAETVGKEAMLPLHTDASLPNSNHGPNGDDDSNSNDDGNVSLYQVMTRLAMAEAREGLDHLSQVQPAWMTTKKLLTVCRITSAAGASALWFGGSAADMTAAGILAVVVAQIGTVIVSNSNLQRRHLATEVIASVLVGATAATLALQWPEYFSWGGVAIPATMDLLQGFKVVFATMEVTSQQPQQLLVAGSARLVESVMVTGLISGSLRLGLQLAHQLLMIARGDMENLIESSAILFQARPDHALSRRYIPLILPLSTFAWSVLFGPRLRDVPVMALHGMLAYGTSMCCNDLPLFVSSLILSVSARVFCRMTGTLTWTSILAGLYALVPGAYMVQALLSEQRMHFVEAVLVSGATIGLGAWAGLLISGWLLPRSVQDLF